MTIVFPKCLNEECHAPVKTRGYCVNHYNQMMRLKLLPKVKPDYSCTPCSVDDCDLRAYSKGMCKSHYNAFTRYGRTEILVKKGHNKGLACSVDGCEKPARKTGLCQNHYEMQRKYGRLEKLDNFKSDHPLYGLWVDKLSTQRLSPEWADDFWTFAKDVGVKPEGNLITLELIDTTKLYGPDNFRWVDNLTKKEGETNKEWNARQWKSRKENFPDFEVGRHLEANFGITKDDYLKKWNFQGGVCKICKQPETSLHSRDGKERVRRLAVDHCHETEMVRDLLCWRCNSTFGKMEENIDIIRAMADYAEYWHALKPSKEPS